MRAGRRTRARGTESEKCTGQTAVLNWFTRVTLRRKEEEQEKYRGGRKEDFKEAKAGN
jgi:hypothetical protein